MSRLAARARAQAQEPSRPPTTNLASNSIRRSTRIQRRSLPKPLSLPKQTGLNGTGKHNRPFVLLQKSHNSRLRNKKPECGQIKVHVEGRSQHAASRGSATSAGSSARTAKTAVCNRKSWQVKELEERLDAVLKVKEELAAHVREYKVISAQSTLKHLEEYFTCPLCFEILGCGGWHEAVDCPLCRTALPLTPERTPRSNSTFPFTPNRTADTAVLGLVNTISHDLGAATTIVPTPLSNWNKDGYCKQEWSKREREGRAEMTSLAVQWNTLKPSDFVNIKNNLEV